MEQIVLDPDEVAGSRTELDITDWIKADGVDWGDAEVTSYMAEAARGQLPVDFRMPNRVISIPFNLRDRGVIIFEEVRARLQAKAALFQREGGWLKRETPVGPVYADVVGASLRLGGSNFAVMRDLDMDAVLTLECIPDFYGDWVTPAGTLGTGELSLALHNVLGDFPARVRLLMDNGSAVDQRGMIWGIRCRHYSAEATAAIGYDVSDLDPLDAATTFGTAIIHSSLLAQWTPVFSTAILGVGPMTHTGTCEVWVRAQTSSDVPPELRFLWDVGDLALPVENTGRAIPGTDAVYDVKLGQVRLDEVGLGDHRWGGVLQAKGAAGGENVSVNRIWFVPVDEGYGELRAPVSANVGLSGLAARDEFNQTAGALTGKTAPVGGTWAGAGDASDFSVVTGQVIRPVDGDVAGTGRWATLDTNMGSTVVQVDFGVTAQDHSQTGVVARFASTTNHLRCYATRTTIGAFQSLTLVKRVAGVDTQIGYVPAAGGFASSQTPNYSLRLMVDTAGRFFAWLVPSGAEFAVPLLSGIDTSLATAGALATGDVGIYDEKVVAEVGQRSFDNFSAWVPDPDAVMFASQSTMLTTDGMFREDLFGTSWAPVSHIVGDLPRLPPSGGEGRPVEVFVKISRGDLDAVPDSTADALGIVASYRPSWLTVPGA